MATSVHIPKELLTAVDRKARKMRISRNRLIIHALEREVTVGSDWSPGFFEQLASADSPTVRAVEEVQRAIVAGRRSKKPPLL